MEIWKIALITLIAFIYRIDRSGTQIAGHNCIFYGTIVGLVCGDVYMGMTIGATVQLMALGGIAALGGSSVPDYPLAAMVSSAIAVSTGQGLEVGLVLGLPVGMLAVQLDVMDKIFNGFIARLSQKYANEGRFRAMTNILFICPLVHGLTVALPVLVSVTLGRTFIEYLLAILPHWFTGGLAIAGKLLPIVGIAVLLRYMPVKKYWEYLLIGFVFAAYLKMPILGIAILGCALAYKLYKEMNHQEEIKATAAVAASGRDDEDE